MPYSTKEETKRSLYNSLVSNESVIVTLELNPYINVLNKKPLELELQYCNVFFRHRSGDYFNQL